ncbi:putative nucleotidyltransferase substrate binding domain-containing protein, partial [Pseudoalteromonas piscicida]
EEDEHGAAVGGASDSRRDGQDKTTAAREAGGRNLIITQSLSSLERDLLRDALSRVKDFKQRLSHRYHLEY